MSKYTTEVRFICEEKAGLIENTGSNKVDEILEKSWNKIFDNSWAFYDETERKKLCKKILRHYYTNEIGFETVGLWTLYLNTKMGEIMPYYNQLYESARIKFEPLKDIDYTETGENEKNTTENNLSVRDGNTLRTDDLTRNTDGTNKYSDTPQGGLNGVLSSTYLTNATKDDIIETNTGTQENKIDDSFSEDKTLNDTGSYSKIVSGKMGGKNYSEMLLDYRKTMLNIDMMVIDELSELFMRLW